MKLFPDIKPKEASKKLEIEYTKSFCNSFYLIKNKPLNTTKTPKKTITLGQGKPSKTEDLARIIESIENPVAFASAHIFKKMIETGDVRWAQLYVSVLDKTKKLDYETIKEEQWLKQANNMSMDDLVSRVAMKGSTSKNILRRLEEAEDTSVYDNF